MSDTNHEAGIMDLIYNKINDMIGAGNQLFSMQFPAQPLNPNLYRYDTQDRNSILTRPFTVAEQEFRLSDQLFDISPITNGSNGEKLSVVYNTLLNNMIPKLDYLVPFIKDRAGLGHWLLEATDRKDEKGNPYSRIELCKKLYQEYLVAKNAWNEEKNEKFEALRKKPGGIDQYAKWQSSYGMVRTEQLNNLYNDVVVTGHLHEVLTILGYLNASSIAEELELSKQKMRNSVRLSLDESLAVYPVQMSPNNWFKALSPNLNPEDLTMAKDSLRDIYRDKQKELLRAKGDLQKALLMNATQADVDAAQKKVDDADELVTKAESELVKQYGEGIVGVAKIYFETFANPAGSIGAFNEAKAESIGADKNQAYLTALKAAVEGISETYGKQQALTKAIGDLTKLSAKKAEVESKEWAFNKEALQQRVNELEMDVQYYGELLSGVVREHIKANRITTTRKSFSPVDPNQPEGAGTLIIDMGFSETITGGTCSVKIGSNTSDNITLIDFSSADDTALDTFAATIKTGLESKWAGSTVAVKANSPGYYEVTLLNVKDLDIIINSGAIEPVIPASDPALLVPQKTIEEAEIAGMFTDITIKIDSSTRSEMETSSSSSSATKWGVSLWFASASGSSSQSSAASAQRSAFFNQDIEIGFRVAKVSFDRGGWFNPQIFKMSNAFTRLADIKTSPGLSTSDIKNASKENLPSLTKYTDKDNKEVPYVLPSYPVAMAIVKDVTIKVATTNSSSSAAKSVVENSKATSGGFLCFSVASSSSSKSTSEMAMSGSHGEHFYIKIPGPQVIGYFLQMVPKDTTGLYEPVVQSDGTNEVLEAFRLYNTAQQKINEASDIVKPPSLPQGESNDDDQ